MAAGVRHVEGAPSGIAIPVDPTDPVASSAPPRWAAGELAHALTERGMSAAVYGNAAEAPTSHLRIVAAGIASRGAAQALASADAHADALELGR